MLSMTVELWPYGDESAKKRLVTITLANLGVSENGMDHDYAYTIDEPTPLFGAPIQTRGTIKNYNRKASCVAIMHKILDDYTNGVVSDMPDRANEICDILRTKLGLT